MENRKELTGSGLLMQALMLSILILIIVNLYQMSRVLYFQLGLLKNFTTIFLSIILEGFPFIIIGALVSSLIQVFVSEDMISRVIPKNNFMGLLMAAAVGLIFPVCECGIVPIVRRLIKKGVPVGMAMTFMLAVPIVNPVVLASTYYAFLGQPMVVVYRAVIGAAAAICIGYLAGQLQQGSILKNIPKVFKAAHNHEHDADCGCGHEHHHHAHYTINSKQLEHNHSIHNHINESDSKNNHNVSGIISEVVEHTSIELYDIGKFFILGALLSSAMQTFVPRSYILAIGNSNLTSILVMMAIAFLLSICSETDAFIARTFAGQFTSGSIIAFLIFGPMLDMKNTLMLAGSFKMTFVVKLIFLIVAVCFLAAVTFNLAGIYI